MQINYAIRFVATYLHAPTSANLNNGGPARLLPKTMWNLIEPTGQRFIGLRHEFWFPAISKFPSGDILEKELQVQMCYRF